MKTLTKEFKVQDVVTAASVGSGGLEVLSSPSIMAWMENVSYELCQNYTDNDETTVGIEFSMKHLAPTAVGKLVSITAKITEQNKSILTLSLEAMVDGQLIASADHKRAKVNKEIFLEKL